jgi:CsoR family transcriptional regulator, copper-sensing transcriptional repressor
MTSKKSQHDASTKAATPASADVQPQTPPHGEGRLQLDPEELTAVIHRLRRAQGQVGGIVKLLESGADCADVVTQLSAASKALDRAGFVIIASGLEQCITRGDEAAGIDRAKLQKLFLSLA